MEDTPALPPQLTFEERCLHETLWIIYSNAWKQSLDNDTSIKRSLNRGWLVYINAVHLGERSQQTLHLLFCGEMAEKRKMEVHRKNLKILLFFFLSPLLYSPFFFFFSSFFKSQRECVGELVVCTKMKSRGHPFEILLKSKLPFHFNSSQETESGATANCFGHIVIYCV